MMDSLVTMQTVWFYILVCLFAGYTLLDGFDLGVGMLFGLRKDEESRAQLMASITPFWDGNEVWLLTAGASLFAAFPFVFAGVLSGMYPEFIAAVLALMLRAVSFEFWHHDTPRRAVWGTVFSLTSLLIPFVLGMLLGTMVQGVWINYEGEIWNVPGSMMQPVPVLLGLLGVCATLLHGIAFAAIKTGGSLRTELLRLALWVAIPAVVLFGAVAALLLSANPGLKGSPVVWAGIGISIAALSNVVIVSMRGFAGVLFGATSALIAGLWVFIAGVHFPYLVRATNIPRYSMTVFNASSSLLNLQVMAVCVIVGMAIVVGYTIMVYRIFKGKTTVTGEGY